MLSLAQTPALTKPEGVIYTEPEALATLIWEVDFNIAMIHAHNEDKLINIMGKHSFNSGPVEEVNEAILQASDI